MAYSASYTVSIKAPQTKVFDYLADVSRHGEWGSSDDRMKISAEKPGSPAVGARYQADALLNGKQNKSVVKICPRTTEADRLRCRGLELGVPPRVHPHA